MMLYSLRKTPNGRLKGEFPLGSLRWENGLVVEIRDRHVRDAVKEYFQEPVWVPLPLGDGQKLLAHTWECLEPGDEEHFMEAARRLYRKDLYLDMKRPEEG